jgi:hypothetical protein
MYLYSRMNAQMFKEENKNIPSRSHASEDDDGTILRKYIQFA